MTDSSVTAPAPKVPCIIAVDGPAASGKGTLARRLAAHYDFAYLDTGALYRAVALSTIEAGGEIEREKDAVKAAENLNMARLEDGDFVEGGQQFEFEVKRKRRAKKQKSMDSIDEAVPVESR